MTISKLLLIAVGMLTAGWAFAEAPIPGYYVNLPKPNGIAAPNPANPNGANKGTPVAPAPVKDPATPGNGGKQISDQGSSGGISTYKK